MSCFAFVFTVAATTEIYTLSLHDALPIFGGPGVYGDRSDCQDSNSRWGRNGGRLSKCGRLSNCGQNRDRKSTRLNSSHVSISYAVFCLKKKKKKTKEHTLSGTTTYAPKTT